MDEIPHPLKKILAVNAILAFISAIIYVGPVGPLDIISAFFSWPAFDSLYRGIFSSTQLIFGIFAFLVVDRKEIKQVQLFLELLIAWQVMTVFINIFYGIILSSVPLPLVMIWVNNAIFLVMIVINIYYYRRYRK